MTFFDLSLQGYDKNTDNEFFINSTEVSIDSRRERIDQIFGRCAWAQSSGFRYCVNDTQDNHTTISKGSSCLNSIGGGLESPRASVVGSIIASLGTVLTLTCAILYICFGIKLRARAANLTGRSDMHKLRWRLNVIVLLGTFCWIPVTILHWIVISDTNIPNMNIDWFNDTTAAMLLSSQSVQQLIFSSIHSQERTFYIQFASFVEE